MRSRAGLGLQGLFELFATGEREHYILCLVFLYLDVKDFSQILVVWAYKLYCALVKIMSVLLRWTECHGTKTVGHVPVAWLLSRLKEPLSLNIQG